MFSKLCLLLLLWPQTAQGYTMPQQYSADVIQKRAEAAVLAASGGYGAVPMPNYVQKPEASESSAVVEQPKAQIPTTYGEEPNYAGVKESKPVVQIPTSYGVEPQKSESAAVSAQKPKTPHTYAQIPKQDGVKESKPVVTIPTSYGVEPKKTVESAAVVGQSTQQKPKTPHTYAQSPKQDGVKESKPVVQIPTSYGVEPKKSESAAVVEKPMQQKPKTPHTYAQIPKQDGVKESKPVVAIPTSYGVEPQKPASAAVVEKPKTPHTYAQVPKQEAKPVVQMPTSYGVEPEKSESAAVVAEKAAGSKKPAAHGYAAPPKAQPVVADKPKVDVPTSYAAYASVEAVRDTKPEEPQSYASYGEQAANVVSSKEAAQGPSPPPAVPAASYGEVPKIDKPVVNTVAELPPPPPPANYGSIPSVAVVDKKPDTTVLPPTTQTPATTKKTVDIGSYGQEPVQEKPAVVAQLPTGYGEVPQPKPESKDIQGSSISAQIPASYGEAPNSDWRKDQVVAENQDERKMASEQQQDVEEAKSVVTDRVEASTLAPEGSTTEAAPETMAPTVDTQVNVGSENNEIQEQEQAATTTMAPAPPRTCADKNEFCDYWKGKDECEKNPAYMRVNCPVSCGTC